VDWKKLMILINVNDFLNIDDVGETSMKIDYLLKIGNFDKKIYDFDVNWWKFIMKRVDLRKIDSLMKRDYDIDRKFNIDKIDNEINFLLMWKWKC
jgi:hypothetical protein